MDELNYFKPFSFKGCWFDVVLTPDEELLVEKYTQEKHKTLFIECLVLAEKIIKTSENSDLNKKLFEIALKLFEFEATPTAYYKEQFAFKKFLKKFPLKEVVV